MTKSVTIKANPRNKPAADPRALDVFVQGEDERSATAVKAPKVPMKRLTFDVAADLHKRIRMTCLERGKDMAEELRRILQENFPAARP